METIKSDRLVLRRPKKSDALRLISVLNDELVAKYIPHWSCKTLEETKSLLNLSIELCDYENDFCFIIKEHKNVIGIIEAYVQSDNIMSISYAIKESARGNGYMTEALKTFIQHLQRTTNVNAIEFSIRNDNASSKQVMQKLGISVYNVVKTYTHFRISLKEALPW